jgi:RNA polymerase sigma factor (sigma-70 family)
LSNRQRDESEDNVEIPTFDDLLTTNGTFYRMESRRLAVIAAEMKVPPSEIEDVIAEVWLEAAKYRPRFAGGDAEKRLHCWLTLVGHSKAVDALRHLRRHSCESLDRLKVTLIDDAEARREAVAEFAEWLDAMLESLRASNEEPHRLLTEHFFHGRSIRELAQESGTTVKSVANRIRRLLIKLHELLDHTLGGGEGMA